MNTLRSSYKPTGNTLRPSLRSEIKTSTNYAYPAVFAGRKWCAIAQIVIGFVSTVSGIITISCSRGIDKNQQKCKAIDNSSYGIWSGVIYITTGVLGVCTRNHMKRLQVSLYIGFSTFSCATSVSGIVVMIYYFAKCSGCVREDWGLTAKVFFRFTSYAVLVFAHSNGMTFSIIGASLSCCGMECCNQSPNAEELMSYLQDNTRTGTLSKCPKPPSSVAPTAAYTVSDIVGVEQDYFEADNPVNKPPLSNISAEDREPRFPSETTEKQRKSRYQGVKLLPTD